MAIRFRQMQTKEGREQIRLARDARTLDVPDHASQDTEQQRIARAAWTTETMTDNASSKVAADDDAACQAVLRGGVIPSWMYARRDLMLRVLPPDDPRARYLRAGGRLDENGMPVIVSLDSAKKKTPTTTTTDTPPSSSSAVPAVPAVPVDAATVAEAFAQIDDAQTRAALRDVWTRSNTHLPPLPDL